MMRALEVRLDVWLASFKKMIQADY